MFVTLAAVATVAALFVNGAALFAVLRQMQHGLDSARAQTTIAFQAAFAKCYEARVDVIRNFPFHESSLDLFEPEDRLLLEKRGQVWSELSDLSDEQVSSAVAVVNKLNDVTQYVADGMSMRSALQQYHIPFIQLGFLLTPYIEARNEPVSATRRPPRWGRRVVPLFNSAIAYHKTHSKHEGRSLSITRSIGGGEVALVLVGPGGRVSQFAAFEDEPGESWLISEKSLGAAIRNVESVLRR